MTRAINALLDVDLVLVESNIVFDIFSFWVWCWVVPSHIRLAVDVVVASIALYVRHAH